MSTSLCETCPDPGHCCRKFELQVGKNKMCPSPTKSDARRQIRANTGWLAPARLIPMRYDLIAGNWLFRCLNLTPTGRCSVYEDRPRFCRTFKPGTDPLCARWQPDIAQRKEPTPSKKT